MICNFVSHTQILVEPESHDGSTKFLSEIGAGWAPSLVSGIFICDRTVEGYISSDRS